MTPNFNQILAAYESGGFVTYSLAGTPEKMISLIPYFCSIMQRAHSLIRLDFEGAVTRKPTNTGNTYFSIKIQMPKDIPGWARKEDVVGSWHEIITAIIVFSELNKIEGSFFCTGIEGELDGISFHLVTDGLGGFTVKDWGIGLDDGA